MKRSGFMILVIVTVSLILVGCGSSNDLSIKVDKDKIEANENGNAIIDGKVEGDGTLFVNSEKIDEQPSENGNFKVDYKLNNPSDEESISLEYIDDKDNSNSVSTTVVIEANHVVLEKKRQEETEQAAKEEKKRLAEDAKMKKTGYSFEIKGDENNEGKHIVTKYEAGIYTIECTFVPMRKDFELYKDYSDLTGYITVFPDVGEYDMAMDADKGLYDFQLTSELYLNDVQEKYEPSIETKVTDVELQEGNEIRVLNCTIKIVKQ